MRHLQRKPFVKNKNKNRNKNESTKSVLSV